MSMPNIPNINADINITREDSINLIISSIGLEELSLAHLLNAEAEKIQFALGTLETAESAQDMATILEVNNSAGRVLRDVIKNQIMLEMKLEDVISIMD